jgi:ATP-dependent Lon protease
MDKKSPEKDGRLPRDIPILPLRDMVAFPFSLIPLAVGIPRWGKLVEDALQGDHIIGLVAMKDPSIELSQAGQILKFVLVDRIDEALEEALLSKERRQKMSQAAN